MAATTQQDWIAEALDLHEQGLSERAIAEAVGKAPSTVHKYLQEAASGSPDVESLAVRQKRIADEAHEAATAGPGQLDIDGGEVPAQQEPSYVEEIRVDGTTQLGLIDFGGKRPSSATITLRGGAYELLEGRAFRKGDVVTFSGTAVVTEVGAVDKPDPKTGIVVSAKQKHIARITDLSVSS